MRLFPPFFHRFRDSSLRERGSALVIVLAFVVLLTVIALAVFTRAMSARKVSASSSNQMKVSAFGDGAVNAVLGDLHAEIVAKSTASTFGSGPTAQNLYVPTTAQDMVPERQSDIAATLPNLIARSASGKALYTGGSDRASADSSKDPSQNGRYISPARWNSHFLLPKADPSSDTDATPDATFNPPDWILVAKDGTNPKSGNADVVGRYAYAVYDEGGLLDLNAAGYPSVFNADQKAQRGSLAFADLTQLTDDPTGAGGSPLLTPAQIDAIVGRRNFVSASIDTNTGTETALGGSFPDYTFSTTNAENYRRFGLFNSANFLTTPRKNILSSDPSASDRMFLNRQEMISFLMNGVAKGVAADRAKLQNSLQYFTQFTRDINQPSVIPFPAGSVNPLPILSGYGNDAVKKDLSDETGINPNFLKLRRDTELSADNTVSKVASKVGEPVVRVRFPLNRIAWITYKGPIATESGQLSSDPDIKSLIDFYKKEGLSEDFLKQGTPTNIQKAFGLTWESASSRTLPVGDRPTGNVWVYRKEKSSPSVSAGTDDLPAQTLNQLKGAAREPDFFELLRASVKAGALTRSIGNGNDAGRSTAPGPLKWQNNRDQSAFLALLQLGANIIDQFDPDGYPIIINAAVPNLGGSVEYRLITGNENLPYIYRSRLNMVAVDQADPPAPEDTYPVNSQGNQYDPKSATNASVKPNSPPLKKTGVALCLLMPDVWNPYREPAAGSLAVTLAPTHFRIVADGLDPDSVRNSYSRPFGMIGWKNNSQYNTRDHATSRPGYPFAADGSLAGPTANNGAIKFDSPIGANLYRNPTVLYLGGKPAQSNLTVDPIRSEFASYRKTVGNAVGYTNAGVPDPNTNPAAEQGDPIVGIPIGAVPLRFVRTVSGSVIITPSWASNAQAGDQFFRNATLRLQYLRPGAEPTSNNAADWITFDTKYVDVNADTIAMPIGLKQNGPLTKYSMVNAFIDPRTSKFGALFPYSWSPYPKGTLASPFNSGSAPSWSWGNQAKLETTSDGPTTAGTGDVTLSTAETYDGNMSSGVKLTTDQLLNKGQFSRSLPSGDYYRDSDGVLRPTSASNASGTTGLPLANAPSTSQPIILNRPFRSVGELGYVFSGMPWKNIDFFHPESGYSALLDVFCIVDTADADEIVAGKVNLNTRQIPVLKALLAGAYEDETSTSSKLTDSLALEAAKLLVNRTKTTPLQNISDLVGRYDGSKSAYDGFSSDLFGHLGSVTTTPSFESGAWTDKLEGQITGFGESVIRSLADVGTVRIWNLMIDLVAQTGKVSPAGKFVVDGEQHRWVHVAIDRLTGKVIDINTEMVKE